MKYLFVGGPADGERLETEGQRYFRVARFPQRHPMDLRMDPSPMYATVDTYRQERFQGDQDIFIVYMSVRDVPPGGAMAALIAGYGKAKTNPDP